MNQRPWPEKMLSPVLVVKSNCRATKDLLLCLCFFALLTIYISCLGGFLPDAANCKVSKEENVDFVLNNITWTLAATKSRKLLESTGALVQVLRTMEQKQLLRRPIHTVVLVGETSDTFQAYSRAFRRQGANVIAKPVKMIPEVHNDSGVLYVCLDTKQGQEHACQYDGNDTAHRKILGYPALMHLLGRRSYLCNMMNELRKYTVPHPGLGELPLCFVLPDQLQQFHDVSEALSPTTRWLVKPIESFDKRSQLLLGDRMHRRTRRVGAAVAQEAVNNPYAVHGQPLTVRVFVLLTSLTPLRAFVHRKGLVLHKNATSKGTWDSGKDSAAPGKTWSLDQLWSHVEKRGSPPNTDAFWTKVERQILGLLFVVESEIIALAFTQNTTHDPKVFHRCLSCFQLLSVDFTLSAALVPFMTHVDVHPAMRPSRSKAANGVKNSVLSDTIAVLSTQDRVSVAVTEALEKTDLNVGLMYHFCRLSHDICLTEEDLRYLLDCRRQSHVHGEFQAIYPSSASDHLTDLLAQLDQKVQQVMFSPVGRSSINEYDVSKQHLTAQLHTLLLRMESAYAAVDSTRDEQRRLGSTASLSTEEALVNGPDTAMDESYQDDSKDCSHDPSSLSYLQLIQVGPGGRLTPPFHPNVTEYRVTVPFDHLVARVQAQATYCQAEARFDDRLGPSRPMTYALGMGNNRVSIVVIDLRHARARVVNVYALSIFREPISKSEPVFEPELRHRICGLTQSCELKIYPENKCGLQEEAGLPHDDWEAAVERNERLPACSSGSAEGRWVLPCWDCSLVDSCYWKEARWMPFRCRHIRISTPALTQCLSKKKLLFLGDSTNRGIMYQILMRLNGSLSTWEKTHGIRVFDDINGGTTVAGFAYYPQFWLPPNKMPSLVLTLKKLVQRMKPLSNNASTVLVIGGTQWLTTKHLSSVATALRSLYLNRIRVVVKTYGSGFHQQTSDTRRLPLEAQQALGRTNGEVVHKAIQLGFDVVETFNMTTSRFKEFLQGSCVCHYHTAVSNSLSTYRIEGPVNEAYSDILVGRVCREYASRQ